MTDTRSSPGYGAQERGDPATKDLTKPRGGEEPQSSPGGVADHLDRGADVVATKVGSGLTRSAEEIRTRADRLESAGEYLQRASGRDLLEDVGEILRRHPGVTLSVGLGIGFLIGRSLR